MNEETIENLRKIQVMLTQISEFVSDLIEDETYEMPPVNHHSPPAEVEKMVHYQEEVLNKCNGRMFCTPHPKKPLLVEIAKQVPRYIIEQALATMQDGRQRNLDSNNAYINNLDAYYFGILRNMCNTKKIENSLDL